MFRILLFVSTLCFCLEMNSSSGSVPKEHTKKKNSTCPIFQRSKNIDKIMGSIPEEYKKLFNVDKIGSNEERMKTSYCFYAIIIHAGRYSDVMIQNSDNEMIFSVKDDPLNNESLDRFGFIPSLGVFNSTKYICKSDSIENFGSGVVSVKILFTYNITSIVNASDIRRNKEPEKAEIFFMCCTDCEKWSNMSSLEILIMLKSFHAYMRPYRSKLIITQEYDHKKESFLSKIYISVGKHPYKNVAEPSFCFTDKYEMTLLPTNSYSCMTMLKKSSKNKDVEKVMGTRQHFAYSVQEETGLIPCTNIADDKILQGRRHCRLETTNTKFEMICCCKGRDAALCQESLDPGYERGVKCAVADRSYVFNGYFHFMKIIKNDRVPNITLWSDFCSSTFSITLNQSQLRSEIALDYSLDTDKINCKDLTKNYRRTSGYLITNERQCFFRKTLEDPNAFDSKDPKIYSGKEQDDRYMNATEISPDKVPICPYNYNHYDKQELYCCCTGLLCNFEESYLQPILKLNIDKSYKCKFHTVYQKIFNLMFSTEFSGTISETMCVVHYVHDDVLFDYFGISSNETYPLIEYLKKSGFPAIHGIINILPGMTVSFYDYSFVSIAVKNNKCGYYEAWINDNYLSKSKCPDLNDGFRRFLPVKIFACMCDLHSGTKCDIKMAEKIQHTEENQELFARDLCLEHKNTHEKDHRNQLESDSKRIVRNRYSSVCSTTVRLNNIYYDLEGGVVQRSQLSGVKYHLDALSYEMFDLIGDNYSPCIANYSYTRCFCRSSYGETKNICNQNIQEIRRTIGVAFKKSLAIRDEDFNRHLCIYGRNKILCNTRNCRLSISRIVGIRNFRLFCGQKQNADGIMLLESRSDLCLTGNAYRECVFYLNEIQCCFIRKLSTKYIKGIYELNKNVD